MRSVRSAVIGLVCALAPVEADVVHLLPVLPWDEEEGRRMVAEGTLDSVVWESVAPFYAQPLNVRAGELSFLREAIPSLASLGLPTNADSLAAYEPWAPSDIGRFLSDYPHLAVLRPILSFEATGGPIGHISLRLRRGWGGQHGPNYLSMNMGDASLVAVRFRMRLDTTRVLWTHRSLRVSAGEAGSFIVGHFASRLDDGFVIGRRRREADSLSSVKQFLLGGRSPFNGVRWHKRVKGWGEAEVFLHEGVAEKAAAGYLRWKAAEAIDLTGGVTLYQSSGDSLRTGEAVAHGGIAWERYEVRVGIRSCVTIEKSPRIPVECETVWKIDRVNAKAKVIFLPKSFVPRAGRVPTEIRHEIGWSDSGTVWQTELSTETRVCDMLRLRPSLLYTRSADGITACRAGLAVSGAGRLSYEARYQFRAATAGGEYSSCHWIALDLCRGWRFVTVAGGATWYSRKAEYWSGRISLSPEVRLGQAAYLAPLLVVRGRSQERLMWEGGVSQRVRLYEKMEGTIRITRPMTEDGGEATTFIAMLCLML